MFLKAPKVNRMDGLFSGSESGAEGFPSVTTAISNGCGRPARAFQ